MSRRISLLSISLPSAWEKSLHTVMYQHLFTDILCRSWYAVVSWLQRQDFFSQYFVLIQDGCSWTEPACLEIKDDRIPSDLLQSQEAEILFRNYVQILRLEHRKMEYAYHS